MISIKATIFYDGSLWIETFERTDTEGYAVARTIFGKEPTDPEVYEFVLQNYQELHFGAPQEFKLTIKRMNPKRLQREVRHEVEKLKESHRPSTHAQDYMREELEKNKKTRKTESRAAKEAKEKEQFALRQAKKKEKHRGH